ncbi:MULTISPECIES: helix-turn-helix domain-containing protein [Ensifer]|jgi:AraC-like DNA-binding protein|uniref:Helix-turn-helix domain-containing protein n=1 Tax=Ensifer canadensis TaxID=555315 RepID=A0AAW4FPZ0_9HYPH|nr:MULTISPECIES: helix-turn-helix domain-containing protein [Ensifer]KQU86151.1 transcriptional regulator [Ensifer sp. Root31]KQW58766.1 transcriptional regulator [Ensifer sp. Root1252]KQW74470.1 transcriptional regulator [Ensifer sp. Root127]KRC67602.1 transcriptional regulator [Ensifer sp. Root231]KRC98678.1 transcriptional regulator [Ensifer sp. Root258]
MHGTLRPLTLAKRCGIYRERSAPASLAGHVECLWSHTMPEGPPSPMAVVPDGCVDIIWSSRGLAVAGPDRVAAFPVIGPGETVVGLRFRAGIAASWLRTPLCELTGTVVPLDAFWGAAADELHARMTEAGSAAARAAMLAHAVEKRLAAVAAPPADIAACLAELRQRQPMSDNPIRLLAQTTGTSERTLRRRCHEHFGYGAKTLDRILRLQRFLATCRSDVEASLSALALDTGYADQAHLTRETRELTSLSPREIRRQLAN